MPAAAAAPELTASSQTEVWELSPKAHHKGNNITLN